MPIAHVPARSINDSYGQFLSIKNSLDVVGGGLDSSN